MTSAAKLVSVVVPFHNDERWLPTLLESLTRQESTRPWEIVAVNNRSTDGSRDVAERFIPLLPLRIVDAPERANPSYARNTGAWAASGDALIFIDADDAVAPNYVEAMSSALTDHAVVTSRVDSTTLNAPWLRDAHGPPWQEQGIASFLGFLPAAGVNIGIRRNLFERVAGFPLEFHGAEDLAFSWLVQIETGETLHFVPDAVYLYRYRNSYRSLFRQSANWGRDHVVLFRRFRDAGMPGRSFAQAGREWLALTAALARARRGERPALVVRLGYAWGRLLGSARYRVPYP
ncbi:MAG TPA: glycosyltransferase [Vicinamibacterales bacterium]|nr:glycosyltransferase [Vicinamibacterales bacterium]